MKNEQELLLEEMKTLLFSLHSACKACTTVSDSLPLVGKTATLAWETARYAYKTARLATHHMQNSHPEILEKVLESLRAENFEIVAWYRSLYLVSLEEEVRQ